MLGNIREQYRNPENVYKQASPPPISSFRFSSSSQPLPNTLLSIYRPQTQTQTQTQKTQTDNPTTSNFKINNLSTS
jgi:hypothetical protein